MDSLTIEDQARLLVKHVANTITKDTLGTATVAIYDTAWVSMISRIEEAMSRWVFPESFEFLLEQQLPSGGWEACASNSDGILNTLAALLAMKRHQRSTDSESILEDRVRKAIVFLQSSLQEWDFNATMQLGFEVLVSALLAMLEDEGICFAFPERSSLLALNKLKLQSFSPLMLYGTEKTSLLYSLKAFTGIDFNQVRYHKTFGAMMCSPSSTAAYLINAPT